MIVLKSYFRQFATLKRILKVSPTWLGHLYIHSCSARVTEWGEQVWTLWKTISSLFSTEGALRRHWTFNTVQNQVYASRKFNFRNKTVSKWPILWTTLGIYTLRKVLAAKLLTPDQSLGYNSSNELCERLVASRLSPTIFSLNGQWNWPKGDSLKTLCAQKFST